MLCLVQILCIFSVMIQADYWADRAQFIKYERSMALGSNLLLNAKETLVNNTLMQVKQREMDAGFASPETFPPAQHFFRAKKQLNQSEVFSIIKDMPKGGALHIHDTAIVSTNYLLNNLTYRDNLYACVDDKDKLILAFKNSPPEDKCWRSVKELRRQTTDLNKFNKWIRSKLTLEVENPEEEYKDINKVWSVFNNIFATITPMLSYRPVFIDYFKQVFAEFYNDNVKYMEIRGTLPDLYDLNGKKTQPVDQIKILKDISDDFKKAHTDFIGAKFIYAPGRHVDNKTFEEYLQIFKIIHETYPDFVIGFDLVGQEDSGKPLSYFVNELQKIKKDIKYFFHAGETNWNGMSTDMNLVDAVLLNTTRIGHGYALVKHPLVMEEVKKRDIAIEVNPISNQVLMLLKDVRNHPANVLIAQNYPVVISSDDPSFWGATGLSYDFYMAFMGMAHRNADLRMLKQLAINSLYYSAMTTEEKKIATQIWEESWNKFLDKFLVRYTSQADINNL